MYNGGTLGLDVIYFNPHEAWGKTATLHCFVQKLDQHMIYDNYNININSKKPTIKWDKDIKLISLATTTKYFFSIFIIL